MRRLELDAGNTFIKWRLVEPGRILARGRWPSAGFDPAMLQDCALRPEVVWLGSVAGEAVNGLLNQAVAARWQLGVERARTTAETAGVRNSYTDPGRMGVDRWLAMLAAWQLVGEACWIVDSGSAITVDLLDNTGAHQGGYILPGLRLMQQSLLGNTAEVRVDHAVEQASLLPGCDTGTAVAHGANLLLHALAQQLQAGVPGVAAPRRVLLTGGDGAQLVEWMEGAEWHPDLVLDGLQWALG